MCRGISNEIAEFGVKREGRERNERERLEINVREYSDLVAGLLNHAHLEATMFRGTSYDFSEIRAAIKAARRNVKEEKERNERERNEREREERGKIEINFSEYSDMVAGLLDHGLLEGERLFDAMNEFRLLINRKTKYNLQDFRQFSQPSKFERRHNDQINNKFDIQIILSENKNHFVTAYYPKYDDSFKLFAYKPAHVDPDENQKAIARQMYGYEVMRKWVYVRWGTHWPDDGKNCDCNELFVLAYAILLVQGRDPAKFKFKMSNDVNLHRTFYIRKKLFEMFLLDKLMIFDEASD